MRPKTLAEVATLAAQGDSFDRCLANFLDGFYAAPNAAASTPILIPAARPALSPGAPRRSRVGPSAQALHHSLADTRCNGCMPP